MVMGASVDCRDELCGTFHFVRFLCWFTRMGVRLNCEHVNDASTSSCCSLRYMLAMPPCGETDTASQSGTQTLPLLLGGW